MNLKELDNFNLADAVKFHSELNPRLWNEREHLHDRVRGALLDIARDFQEFLGVANLDLVDITISGSNAAYTYTPHSDIDLHLVVKMPEQCDEVYQELFNAKKYQYNDVHNIKVGGADVELYVQDSEQPHYSAGQYSILHNKWLQVPKRQRADVDQMSVQHKYETVKAHIESALTSGNIEKLKSLKEKIKRMRKNGLAQHGELGPENLAFKMLRTQGYIQKLYDALTAEQDRALGVEESRRKPFRYGFREQVEVDDLEQTIRDFASEIVQDLGIKNPPELVLHRGSDWTKSNGSFGEYRPDENTLNLAIDDRHILDVVRTLAHELTHAKQNEIQRIPDWGGETGSRWEDEANAMAGRIMRGYAQRKPELFAGIELNEASGYIPTAKEKNDSRFKTALTVDIQPGQTGREANKLKLDTDSQGAPALLMKTVNLQETLARELAEFKKQPGHGYGYTPKTQKPGGVEDDLGNQEATGPEFPPQMPAGTTKVDVSDLTDWYRLGMDISDMDDADPEDYNQGPPQTVIVFPSDEAEQDYLKQFKRLGLKTHDMDPDVKGGEDIYGKHLQKKLSEQVALLEDEYLNEIRMSTANLRQLAAQTGAQAGMEFEMIVPDVGIEDSEPEYERDDDQDRRARSFDDIESFFYDGDYNGRGDIRRLREALDEQYMEWRMDRTADDWSSEGIDYLRDYIENNDLFDRDEAVDQARDEFIDANPDIPADSEEAQQGISARVNELLEQFVQDEFDAQGRIYNDAFTEFADEKNQDYDESDFLEDVYPYMSDVESEFDITWPYYYDANEGRGGEADVDQVADEFSSYMNKPVNASSSYHGARREPGTYVVEPDGSLEGDNPGDTGLEFVSPPMPIDEMLSDLNKVKEWAGSIGAYTNDSTGLHINISVPDYSLEKLDYVKLALLMGDEYVLELFGRSSNTYTKAATGKIRDALRKNPDLAPQIMDKMRGHMEDLATKAVHSGKTDKYTSINTKTGYIEFRSPGGDWLDANFDKIENTLLRFTVALSAAIDPEAYRKEYLKKLYKLLESNQSKEDVDVLQLFANYSAGELDKAALIRQVRQKQLARNLSKGKIPPGQKYWWRVTNPANASASIEVVATSKEEAIEKAVEPGNYPEWARVQNTLRATPLRPYQEPQAPNQTGNWGIWMQGPGRFARAPGQIDNSVLRRFPSREAAEQWIAQTRSTNSALRTDIEVREIEPAAISQPQQGSGAYTYRVFTTDGNQTVGTFQSDGIQGSTNANIAFRNYLTSIGRDSAAGFNYEQIGRERQQPEFVDTTTQSNRGDLTPRGPGPWEIYRISDNSAVRPLSNTSRPEAEQEARSALGLRGEAPELYGVRTRQQAAPQPLGAGQELVGWKIVDAQGRTIHEFSGVGNVQADANNFAVNWLRRNPQHMQAGVEVVPNWRAA